ncbi:unnamed protein product [Rotaria magnacalcarata]|uniref:Piezo-type mechanosensitive ion channel component n=2 Tax=Rotaria magnacalcarata TaxID=392030 RepID=A0A814XBF3_9BILA|nr:unnamed protein product [Rotaria magnacalcarata]
MMYFNKTDLNSTDSTDRRLSSNNTFDIELQHPQPRRRQTTNNNYDSDPNKDQYYIRDNSIPAKQDEIDLSKSNQLLPRNNIIDAPRNISIISSHDPMLIPSLSMVVDEKSLSFMSGSILTGLLFILLPIVLLSGTVFRYSFASFIYGFLLLVIPWLGSINRRNIRTRYRLFIIIVALISLVAIIAQIIFQSILVAKKPYGHTLNSCTTITLILRYFGLERLDNADTIRIIRLIFPDIIIFAVSTICFIIIRRILLKLQRRETAELQISAISNETNISPSKTNSISRANKRKFWQRVLSIIRRIRLFIQFIFVGGAAFVYPSIINSVYFIFFILMAFTWSLSVKFGRKFVLFRSLLVIYAAIHLLTLYLYQFTFFQEFIPPFSLWSNITGLTAIVTTNCTKNEPNLATNLVWNDYANPGAITLLYFYLVFETDRALSRRKIRLNATTLESMEQQSLVKTVEKSDTSEQSPRKSSNRWSLGQPGDHTWQERIVFIALSLLRVLERQSYLLSIISMLVWSITFHSLITLVFLLWACFLWVLPNSRKWCLRMSPFFTLYGGILLTLQYICGLNISFDQFEFAYDRQTMKQIGIQTNDYYPAFVPLLVKSLYMMFFWLTLRQYINERQNPNVSIIAETFFFYSQEFICFLLFIDQRFSRSPDSYPRRLGQWLINILTKYWIFVSCGMLLLVSIQNTVVIYRIIYMAFYLFFILSFQISFGFWRRTAATFHLTIIIYSMIVLIGIYIYQFKVVENFLSARFSLEILASIGLEAVAPDVLAVRLLTPSTFLIVNIMQLYYFHSGWMDLITMPSDKNIHGIPNGTLKDIHAYAKQNTENVNSLHSQQILKNETKTWLETLYKFYFRANRFYKQIIYYSWRFGELHSYKLVLFMMVLVASLKVCAFNVSLIILTTIGLTLLRLRSLINLLTLIITGIYILASMCYQLEIAKKQIIEKNIFVKNCSKIDLNMTLDSNMTFNSNVTLGSVANIIPNDTAKWFGLELTSNMGQFIGVYIILTIVLTLDAIVRYRQRHRRLTLSVYFNVHLIENRFPILFEPFALKKVQDDTYEYDITSYQHADQGLKNSFKYFFNFLFYRFGLEICYITTIIVISVRLDVVAVFYAIWLGLFLISRRRAVRRLWPIYILFQVIAFPLQYMIAVGTPPILCFEYPWTNINIRVWPQLRHWLHLPDYIDPPLATQLITDFFQFLFACQQWRAFAYETNEKDHVYNDAGGSNREIIYDDDMYKNNPTWDFVTNKRHWLDHIKYAVFMYGVWIVLSIVYLAGTTRISLLGLGYLIACFYFLWYGQDFLTKRVAFMLRSWNYLIYYCFSVIFLKTCLQVVVCMLLYPSSTCTVTSRTSSFCIIVDLFVPCLKSYFKPPSDCYVSYKDPNEQCDRDAADASLFMDGVCMIFLLLQKRMFGSYYWEHIVTELRSQAKLASQGAALFNQISLKRMEEDRLREEQTVSKITRNLKRIKEQQSKLNKSDSRRPSTLAESSEHFEAIRSADYYMFDYELDKNQEDDDDEGAQDEADVAQDQIFQVLVATDEDESIGDSLKKPRKSSVLESDVQELIIRPRSPPPLPSTIMEIVPDSTIPEQETSGESKEKTKTKQKQILFKIRLIIWIIVDYFIDFVNRNSHDYRKVSNKLAEMKVEDKVFQKQRMRMETSSDLSSVININGMVDGDGDQQSQNISLRKVSQSIPLSEHSRLYRLFDSLFYFTMSRSELLCYSAMIINHLTSGALLSIPLPLSIFLWATLSPRPTRNFWITILTYTEAMIVVEYIFQFRFYPWNADIADIRPLAAVNIIGIDRKQSATSFADLFLLLSLFLHRSILKQLGLWKSERTTPINSITEDTARNEEQQQQQAHDQLEEPRIKSNIYFMKSIMKFYRQLKQALFVRDVYAPMFFCDFINMVIVIAFYSQFGEQSGGNVVQTIKENKVPVAFLVILLIQFVLIIIDRALYLRRNVRGKLFFQLFQVIAVHVWLFLVLPGITRIKFRENIAAQFWYLFKCVYFGYSSIQVRLGYPKRLAGNFLMKRFNYVNQVLYRIYLFIPFLLELRTIMDWIFTDTALGLTSWLQLEDIYSNVYLLKCGRWAEEKYPTKRGVPRTKVSKYGIGGSLLALLILLIWFPLLFFSFTSSFYEPNPPTEVSVEIKLGGYLPIYKMTAQDRDIAPFTSADYNSFRATLYLPKIEPAIEDAAYAFLRDYNSNDIHCVNLFSTSVDLWEISQPIRDIVISSLKSNSTPVPVRFSYTITRNPPNQDDSEDIAAVVSGEKTANIAIDDRQTRNALIDILNGTLDRRTREFTILQLMPRFLHVKPKAKPDYIKAFEKIFLWDYYANITMSLHQTTSIPNSTSAWWEMSENRRANGFNASCSLPPSRNYMTMIFFNDKISPANISFLTRYGIIGIYISIVSVFASFIRGQLFGTTNTIMFDELPQVDALWHFLTDIYLLRTVREHEIEADFFDRLIYIYRNPQVLLYWTRETTNTQIIGFYTTFVIVVARLLRTILQTSQTIMFNELPNVERFWHLLRDIYLVREHNILRIEEQIFAKIIFLFRSPETLIQFTKPKID